MQHPHFRRYEHAFGPVPAGVFEHLARHSAQWAGVELLDAAWWAGQAIEDWQAFEPEAVRRADLIRSQPAMLTVARSHFGQRVVLYDDAALTWE